MTRWARMRRRKEKRRSDAEALGTRGQVKGKKMLEPERISEDIQHSQEIEKLEENKPSKPNHNSVISKKIFLEHISVVFIFSILTIIVTFPVILDFASETAGFECYDKCHMIWRFWWADFSFENGLDFQHSNYIFYPDGVNIGGNLAYFTTFIGFLLVKFLDYTTVWNVIWFLGLVFGGYGCYLLANNFNRNYLSSIIAGIIFTFTTYHLAHSIAHVGLSMIVWLPIFILFLFKLLEKQSKYYSIAGGIIFFLVSLTHLYYSVFITMFSIIFFTVYVFKQKKVSNKTFITNFSILLIIGLLSTSILFFSNSATSSELDDRRLEEHIGYSNSLENLILPVPNHTTQVLSNDGMITSFYSFFDEPVWDPQIEQYSFLGYSVIFLSALAVIRYRRKHAWFWLLICGIFIVMSFGPELKIFHQSTGIVMPEKIFLDTIPEWDEIRAPARFIVIATLSLAILSSFAVYGLIKNRFSSFKQQLVLTSIIGAVILFEFSMIPFPTDTEAIPDIYEEIKNDESKFAVLPVPIGGTQDYMMMSHPRILYHQVHHEKPIYGGHESRISYETMADTRTYFLDFFHALGSNNDAIKQDLAIHGLSLFDYFDIKYVTIHKNSLTSEGEVRLKQTMTEILNENTPTYEDSNIVVYKIPKPHSFEPFLLLGTGWHTYEVCEPGEDGLNCNARIAMKNSEILMINPTESNIKTGLDVVLGSIVNGNTVVFSMNGKKLNELEIPTTMMRIQIDNLMLVPGVNVLTLDSDDSLFDDAGSKKGMELSLIVEYISIIK